MAKDKFSATWVSHSSITDFLQCPRAYYLKNVYRDPQTNRKIQIMSPPLALGQAVHDVLESLSIIPTAERFKESLIAKFDRSWKNLSGKKGGFFDENTEQRYKRRGEEMLRKVMDNPGPLKRLAIKIKQDLPSFWLSEEDEIILCGKIDWLEYLKDTDSVHIIDFKTSKVKENDDSLQLPIYHLLVHNCQQRKVDQASYWYLGLEDGLSEKELPDLEEAEAEILEIAKKMKLAKKLKHFKCPQGENGCFACRPMEEILKGEAELIGQDKFGRDLYILKKTNQEEENTGSIIL
ncbi:MAG: PD-(D/E)XK nuclease family protein [Candidatus Woesebacteria bacterium]|jgi:ATP-dependent helicase/DNAse subunit B